MGPPEGPLAASKIQSAPAVHAISLQLTAIDFQFNLQYFLSGSLSISCLEMEIARHIPCLPAPKATIVAILSVC